MNANDLAVAGQSQNYNPCNIARAVYAICCVQPPNEGDFMT